MGSLSSRPQVPSSPQIVYVQQPVYTPAPSSSAPPQNNPSSSMPNPVPTAAQAREQNLLERSRGIFGTVLNGFRGFLSTSQSGARKSLLGE